MDYKKLGLKSGLEVHQQLDTGKLFCRCPSLLREDKPDIIFRRKLRAVASEMGEFDAAALEAFKKGLTFEYQAYSDSTCLVEADEEPPQPTNNDALETVLRIALMSDAQILDEIVVMRKAVVDGSNTSAFQRTMLVAIGGKIKLKDKTVGIQSMALEEDAARPIERREKEVVYRVDRLGIPLIELATDPDLKTPEEVKECALKIGELLRRTCKAKRGLGTIRQDLNISIVEGARVEIKGVQQLDMIDEYVKREVQRQVSLIELKKEFAQKGLSKIQFVSKDVASVFAKSECKFLKGKSVFGAKADNFAGLIGKEIQVGRRFGTELADYVKARTGLRGILHSDELPAYGVSDTEVKLVREKLGCKDKDGFILVQSDEKTAEKAFEAITARIVQATKGVPEETRNALEDGNTTYSRPLPGAARMYPETDLELVRVDETYLKELKKELPLTVEERRTVYKKSGLSDKLVGKMVLNNSACLFEKLLAKKVNATTAATVLLETAVQLRREGFIVNNEMIETVLLVEQKGTITKDVFVDLLRQWSKTPNKNFKEVIKDLSFEKVESGAVQKAVLKVIGENKQIVKERGMHALGALMGDVMKELKGKASGEEISKILRTELQKQIQ